MPIDTSNMTQEELENLRRQIDDQIIENQTNNLEEIEDNINKFKIVYDSEDKVIEELKHNDAYDTTILRITSSETAGKKIIEVFYYIEEMENDEIVCRAASHIDREMVDIGVPNPEASLNVVGRRLIDRTVIQG